MKYDIDKIKQESVGKWRGILSNLGISVPDSPQKHGPCPICGPGNNSHRYRFDDQDGKGTWICTQCGSSDGWGLLQRSLGLTFIEAVGRVAEIIGSVEAVKQQSPKSADPSVALKGLFRKSKKLTGADLATRYLRSRGLLVAVDNILHCDKCYESSQKMEVPAMIALIQDVNGEYVGMHRTYLVDPGKKADIESPKKLMPPKKPLAGSAIRLFKASKHVGVAEGIETAIAAHQLFDMPVWACATSTMLESFEPPQEIRNVVVFGDNDANFAGQKSAYRLANRIYLSGRLTSVEIPDAVGDWADVWERECAKSAI